MSLFRGRIDTYARRWEKDGRSGYSPAYDFDWDEFIAFKRQGGTMRDFQNKRLLPLTKDIVKKHLLGHHVIGIYPSLIDNTSYFIAADFDGESWMEEARAFATACAELDLNAYVERSRSGNGGHAWLFFTEPYPCWKSRYIMLEIIRQALQLSEFDKEVSFDRLFPNQDAIPKNGFGNLIALPLQGKSVEKGNTVFVDLENGESLPSQWDFLGQIKKHETGILDHVYQKLFNLPRNEIGTAVSTDEHGVEILLSNRIMLSRSQLRTDVVEFLKEKLNFINTEYLAKKRMGKSVYKVQKYFKLIEGSGDLVLVPRGFLKQLTNFLEEQHISHTITDHRPTFAKVNFSSSIQLHTVQTVALEQALKAENGVIVAPSGSGKTIMALELASRLKLPTLILVHRRQLLDQWVERIQEFLGIAKSHIGQYSGTKKKVGKRITVASMQTLARAKNKAELCDKFGVIIVDECHHVPAKTFRETVSGFNPRFIYGLTATPKRKHNDEKLIYTYIGDIIAEMKGLAAEPEGAPKKHIKVIVRETDLILPFTFATDNFQLLTKLISFDSNRNQQITNDIAEQVSAGKKTLVLSERRDHLEVLSLYLKGICETITISGEDSAAKRALKIKQIQDGHYQAILSTGQFFGEGLDISNINCLMLVFPLAFEGKLAQYIGRLQRGSGSKLIIDYRDVKIPFLEKQFKQRQRYYKKWVL